MKTIAIDIDDVLAENAAGFVAFSNERWGTSLKVDDYDEHWARLWQVSPSEACRRSQLLHDARVMKNYGHDSQAGSVLARLKGRYNLCILTSRRTQMRDDTLEWLSRHYGDVFTESNVYFAGIWDTITDTSHLQTKADMAQLIGADYLIDDQLKHVRGLAERGIQGVLFGDYPWNQCSGQLPEAVVRVSDWSGVEQYFER